VSHKKHEEMSLKELYDAYDLSENQQRKWLVKIAKYWMNKSTDQEINKIAKKILDVAERYTKKQATEEELHAAYGTYWSMTYDHAGTLAYAARAAFSRVAIYTDQIVYNSEQPYSFYDRFYNSYRELLLEVINEMDEFEREIRRNA